MPMGREMFVSSAQSREATHGDLAAARADIETVFRRRARHAGGCGDVIDRLADLAAALLLRAETGIATNPPVRSAPAIERDDRHRPRRDSQVG